MAHHLFDSWLIGITAVSLGSLFGLVALVIVVIVGGAIKAWSVTHG